MAVFRRRRNNSPLQPRNSASFFIWDKGASVFGHILPNIQQSRSCFGTRIGSDVNKNFIPASFADRNTRRDTSPPGTDPVKQGVPSRSESTSQLVRHS